MSARADTGAAAATPPVIVFSHANGFPAGTYRQLFALWREAGFEVRAIEKIGHDERYPVSLNWPHLREQLLHFIEAQHAAPVWLVGHSLGGFLSVLAAARRPDLARGVVLLDSPLLPPLLGRAWQLAQFGGLGERLTPGAVSRRRRQHWTDAAHAYGHFASKKAFARWAPGVLQDYVDAGMEASADGLRLGFDRQIETAIYATLPNHIARLLARRPLQCPVAFIGGSESDEVRRVGLRMTTKVCAGRIDWVAGSHLFPFEHPAETAAKVLFWLRRFGAAAPGSALTRPV